MNNPLVSVIIPTYNRDQLILKAINSVLVQTFQDFEILVIDDASTDNTGIVIKELNHEKIKYFRLDKNGGQCIARNFGISKARGKFVAFLDSDDEWLPSKLEKQIACFRNGNEKLGCVYGYSYRKIAFIDDMSLVTGTYRRGDVFQYFLEGFCPPTPSLFMVKTDAIRSVNGFDEALITFVDLDMWLRLSRHFLFDYVDEPLIIKHEQIGDQYVNNFEKRYAGYRLFMKKWRHEILQKSGNRGLLEFKKHLVYALANPILEHPPENFHGNAAKLIGLLIEIRSVRMRMYLKALLILIFGPRIIYFIRKKLKQ